MALIDDYCERVYREQAAAHHSGYALSPWDFGLKPNEEDSIFRVFRGLLVMEGDIELSRKWGAVPWHPFGALGEKEAIPSGAEIFELSYQIPPGPAPGRVIRQSGFFVSTEKAQDAKAWLAQRGMSAFRIKLHAVAHEQDF